MPGFELALGFIFCDAVAFLYLAHQNLLIALGLLQIITGEFAPLLLHFAFELLPVAGKSDPNS